MSNKLADSIPSTQQAVSQIDQAQNYLDERKRDGGKGAERTVADITEALKNAKQLITEKDLASSVKKLTNDAQIAGEQAAKNAPSGVNAKVYVEANTVAIRDDATRAIGQIRRISQLVVTSPSFRRFLWNTFVLIRDTFGPEVDRALEQRLKHGQKDHITRKEQATKNEGQKIGQQKKQEAAQFANKEKETLKQGDVKTAVNRARDKAQDVANEAEQTVKEKIPKERREELARRWESLRDEIQNDPNLQAAVNDLKATLFQLRDDIQPIIEQAKEQVQVASEEAKKAGQATKQAADGPVQKVAADARDLIEKFANGKSLQPLIDSLKKWAQAIQQDQKLRNWANNMYNFIVESVNDANKLKQDQHLDRLNELIDEGTSLTQGKHKRIAESLLDESRDYIEELRNDRATNKLRVSLDKVVQDLFIDSQGRFVVKPDLYVQLKDALIPSVKDLFQDIHIAHVEEHNDDVDFALDNIVIDASDLQPNQFDVTNIADLSLGKEHTGLQLRFRVSVKGCNPVIRNAFFRYERHTFPKLSDFGSLDASLSGDGLSFNLDVEYVANADEDERNFRCNDVTVSMKNLSLTFRNAQHETLYTLFKPLVVSKVTKQMEQTIREQLYYFVDQLDDAAKEARYRAADAIDQAIGDRISRGVNDNVGHTAIKG